MHADTTAAGAPDSIGPPALCRACVLPTHIVVEAFNYGWTAENGTITVAGRNLGVLCGHCARRVLTEVEGMTETPLTSEP